MSDIGPPRGKYYIMQDGYGIRYKVPSWKPPRFNGVQLTTKDQIKYLVVILDSILT